MKMTPEDRAAWCIANAEAIEKDMTPQYDPHIWDMHQACAAFWRDMARRVLAAHGLGPWPSEDRYWAAFDDERAACAADCEGEE